MPKDGGKSFEGDPVGVIEDDFLILGEYQQKSAKSLNVTDFQEI